MPAKKKPSKREPTSASATNGEEPMSSDLSDYVTTRQAADRLGVLPDHINHLLAKGKIRGRRMGYSWLVYLPSLEAYRQTKSPGGRPPSRGS